MNDDEIINLYFKRDETALSESEKKYGIYCRSVAEKILSSREDSEECFNSALLGAWNSIPPEKPRNLKIFLAKITRNTAINLLRFQKTKKRGSGEAEKIFDELSEFIPSGENVEEYADAKELEEYINRFVKNLPEKERNVFIRRYFFFETPKEIGERYGYSQNLVTVILHRTRKKLEKHLIKGGFLNERN